MTCPFSVLLANDLLIGMFPLPFFLFLLKIVICTITLNAVQSYIYIGSCRYGVMIQLALVRFSFDRKALGLSLLKANKFYRTLYGYHNSSHYGRYHHWVNGFIDDIDGKKIASSMILLPNDNITILTNYLEEHGSEVQIVVDKFFMEEKEFDKIISMGKEAFTPK